MKPHTLPVLITLTLLTASLQTPLASAAEHTRDSLETVKKRVDKGDAVLLDVRELSEWKAGHIKDAKFSPLSSLKTSQGVEEAAKKLPKDKIIYCHCRSGGRCLIATDILKKQGLDIRALKPGYTDLVKAGFPKAED